jgi:hypothetical protein
MCKLAGAIAADGVTFAVSCVAQLFNLGILLFRSQQLAGAVGASSAVLRYSSYIVVRSGFLTNRTGFIERVRCRQ